MQFFLWLCSAVLSVGLLNAVADTSGSVVPTRVDNDAATRKGYEYFYNLEYDKAIHEFELAQAAHPDDPFALNHLLGAVVFKELYRIGALDTEAYAADSFLDKKLAAPLDPAVRDRVKRLTDQGMALSQAQLNKNPNDVNALYARGATRAVNATYMGVANHAWIAALRSAVAARHDNERVLELDPKYVDAKVAVGTHLYIVGSLSWPVKVAASVAGLSGNKQKGLDDLRDASASPHVEVATDAKILLALSAARATLCRGAAGGKRHGERVPTQLSDGRRIRSPAQRGWAWPGSDRGLPQGRERMPAQPVERLPH